MALYKYVFNEKHGDFNAHVFDENGREIWKVRYPDYYEDEESGELIEDDTLFDRGYMKSVYDVDGLEGYLKKIGVLQKDDHLFSQREWEEHYEEEYAEGGGINLLTESEEKEYRQLYRLYLLAYKVYFSIQKSSLSESSKMYEDDYWYYEYDKADRELEYFVDDLKDKYEGKEEQLKHELSLIQNEVIEEVESETKMADGGYMAKGGVIPDEINKLYEFLKNEFKNTKFSINPIKYSTDSYRIRVWDDGFFTYRGKRGINYANELQKKFKKLDIRTELRLYNPQGHETDTIIVREKSKMADGGVMDVRMEDTVQRMDDPHFADISYYAKGGSLEAKIKKLLVDKQSFDLPLEMAVYVPSTEKANQIIPKRDFARRIEDVQVYLSQLFGGFSSVDVEGGYESSEKGLIQEDVTKVVAFANRDGFEDKFNQLMNRIVAWCKAWSQESIGFEFEGDLFYISENAKFSYGGGIDDDEAMQRKMILKQSRRFDKPQPEYYSGYDKRHYQDEKPYSPIKYDDLPLDKFLQSKYNKRK